MDECTLIFHKIEQKFRPTGIRRQVIAEYGGGNEELTDQEWETLRKALRNLMIERQLGITTGKDL